MIEKNTIIRLFFTIIFLILLYYFSKQIMFKVVDARADDTPTTTYNVECETLNNSVSMPKVIDDRPKYINLGKFKLTGYCPCKKCCGKCDGITSTGVKAKQGRTIAVDPKIIPYGSKVKINGKEYVAEDCGGAIKNNHIDVFFNTHDEALEFGVRYENIYKKIGD